MRRNPFHVTAGLALLLVAALLSIPGCGGKKDEPAPPAQSPAQAPAPAAQTPAAPAPSPATGGLSAPAGMPVPTSDPAAVLAKVDGRPITTRQVLGLAAAQMNQLRSQGQQLPPEAEPEIRRAALQFLIDGELMAQAARKSGIRVEPKQVDDLLATMKSRIPSEEEYRKFLEVQKLTENDLRADLEGQLLAAEFANRETAQVKADEAAARKLYEENKQRFTKPEEAHALQIAVYARPSDPAPSREEARKKIDEAYAKAKAGEDFGELAKKYSQASNAAQGGDAGFVPRGAIPEFDRVAFTIPIGEVSPVFETRFGYNIIKVVERRPGGIASWEEIGPELLRRLTDSERAKALEGKLVALRSRARIEILAPEYRPAPAPAPGGGGAAAN